MQMLACPRTRVSPGPSSHYLPVPLVRPHPISTYTIFLSTSCCFHPRIFARRPCTYFRILCFLLSIVICPAPPQCTQPYHPIIPPSRDFFICAVWRLYPWLWSWLWTGSLASAPMSYDQLLTPPNYPSTGAGDTLQRNIQGAGPGTDQSSQTPVGTVASHHRIGIEAHEAGTFFPAAQNFTVSGGNFTSHVQQIVPRELPPDFRTIPLGDIDLQAELGAEGSGYLHPRRRERSVRVVRTMYSAKVEGREMTAVLYEGDEQAKEVRCCSDFDCQAHTFCKGLGKRNQADELSATSLSSATIRDCQKRQDIRGHISRRYVSR
ncbi:hypothetical protein C8F01DRAFT_332414 [Mycena amicta]|nr:hypothetical protein C8F01DRAFT_332414 [Mycena amicta]